MDLYLVGENIDKHRVSYLTETGKLVQIMRGVYVDSNSDIEHALLEHAIRIAKYLYPRAYLSGASAVLLSATPDGKLYITGPRNQRTRLRSLEIIQNKAPASASLATATIQDSIGEFNVDVSSIRQRFLASFRRRSEHAASIPLQMQEEMGDRVIAEYGDIDAASNALWVLARQNEWFWEVEQAERFLKRKADFTIYKNQAETSLVVAWHGTPIGNLVHDGFEWHWTTLKEQQLPLVRQTIPGKLPPFISSLLPEGWLESVLNNKDERAALQAGKRYMSNITIAKNINEIKVLPADILETPLRIYSKDGVFTGRYAGPLRGDLETSFESNLAKIFHSSTMPRLSGVQIKAPMFLDSDGTLCPSEGKSFTHILKPAGTSGFEFLPLIEWMCLTLARSIGFDAPNFAFVPMPDNMQAALVVERFDIRRSHADTYNYALEDFCSLLDLAAADKYKGTIEQSARALRAISTDPKQDIALLFQRALFAWLIADGDMHLKNMAVLKISVPNQDKFQTVRMAPIYDAVSTVVFPGLENDHLALKMNGKDHRLKRADFLSLSKTIGLKKTEAELLIETTLSQLAKATQILQLPTNLSFSKEAEAIAHKMLQICMERINNL